MSDCQSSDSIGYHTLNQLSIDNWGIWQTLVLSWVGVQGDRPLKYTVGSKCAFGTRWEFGLMGYATFFIRFSSHSIMDSWKCKYKCKKLHVSSSIRS